jgi:two-component system invasion response regulator UvrY
MNADLIRIILVDDHKLVRQSWKYLLQSNPRFQVIAECENGYSAVEEAVRLQPEIMLVDMNMKPLNGFDVTGKIMERAPYVKIIGLSVNNYPTYATRMLELGARGYLTKTSPIEEINFGILEVHRGVQYICEEVKRNMSSSGTTEFL